MKVSFFSSLGFKIGVMIIAVEAITLALLGRFYVGSFSEQVDHALLHALEKPGDLMSHGIINLNTVADRRAFEKLAGEGLVDAMIVGANGNVFHATRPELVGMPATNDAFWNPDWLVRAKNSPVIEERRVNGDTFVTRVATIGAESGRDPFLFSCVCMRTTAAEKEKAALQRYFFAGSIVTVVATTVALLACFRLLVIRRLAQVGRVVGRVADGDFTARVLDPAGHDEISVMGRGVDQMAGKLQSTIRSLEETVGALRTSEERYRAVVTWAPVIIFATDRNGVFTLSEGVGLERLGLKPGEVVGSSVFDIYRDTPEVGMSIRRTLAGQSHKAEINVQGLSFECWFAPITDADGSVTGAIGVATDTTARKVAEEERLKLERQVLHAQKLESLGVLAGGIAHDFNNILTAIIGHSDMVEMQLPAGSPLHRHLSEIQKASMRAADLARQMLAYSGRGKFFITEIRLNDVIREMGQLLSVSVSKKVELRYELAGSLPVIEGDATQIGQVVMNLITNASEAIGDNPGIVTMRSGVMDCDAAFLATANPAYHPKTDSAPIPGPHVFIEVQDTGSGMDTATLERIFDPFFTTKFTGRGLGLAAVMGIVRGHHGAMKVDSHPGNGTTFRILFPAFARPPTPAGGPAPATPAVDTWRGSGLILVVDDEEQMRALANAMLGELGFRVITAADGHEAVEQFARRASEIRCVLLDLTMPRLDGHATFEALQRIRASVPVILCSGYGEQTTAERFGELKPAAFLSKPFTFSGLTDCIRQVLAPRAKD